MATIQLLCFLLLNQFMQLLLADTGNCPTFFNCGNLGQIQFPFTTKEHPDCGLFAVQGCLNQNSSKSIRFGDKGKYFDVAILSQTTVLIQDPNIQKLLENKSCETFKNNYTLPFTSPFASFVPKNVLTFFRCNRKLNVGPPASSSSNGCSKYDIHFGDQNPSYLSRCPVIKLPSKERPFGNDAFSFIASDILIEVEVSHDCNKCHYHGKGLCQVDSNGNFHCTKDRSRVLKLRLGDSSSKKLAQRLGIGFGVLLVVVVAGLMVKFYSIKWKKENPTNQMIESFLKKYGSLRTKRYAFSEIKKVTKSFQNKLGQGGYGNVYQGQLNDGQFVAVKVLNEFKGTGEEFINEVASISNTSHVNIVTLLGFCFEGSKRALIYEFMPNGSLEKFIYQENNLMIDRQLDCKTLYNIAIGIARGLEYLHRGCNTRILHFDIKPHNILLDRDFCPKISDFGLAKICPERESIVSLIGARGTIGYIAPEVISRNFGTVSHKSDVYSYGMMVLEMVGGRKNVNIEVDCSSEIYFPHWIYKRLELNQEILLRCIRNEIDEEKVRKMTLVSLWCIQTYPSKRPTMSKVVEMLEGCLESLQIPPKPYLSSPSTSPAHYANTCNSE